MTAKTVLNRTAQAAQVSVIAVGAYTAGQAADAGDNPAALGFTAATLAAAGLLGVGRVVIHRIGGTR
jgi:hypothetical protein